MTSLKESYTITETKLQELIDAYGNELLRLCALYLKDKQLAEDALQETYIKVWQKYYTYDGRSNEKTWITRIAINTCKNYMRTRWYKEYECSDIWEIVGAHKDPYEGVIETIDVINSILKLKEKYRVVLIMYYYQEFQVKEIAEILGKKESTILSLLGRGRKIIKNEIMKENDTKEVAYEY